MFLKSFKTRITLLFTLIFLLCAAILFFASYFIVQSSLESEQRALLRSRLLEFYATYQTGNIEMVSAELNLERMYRDERVYMLRIAGRGNDTRLLYVPPGWEDFPFRILENINPISENNLITLKNPGNGEELTIASLSLPDRNILQIGISNSRKTATLAQFREAFLLTLIPLTLLCALGGMFFATRFLSPVKKLAHVTREISSTGNLEKRIPAKSGGDELADLVVLFNGMLTRIENLVTGMRDNLDHVAHDIRTPLTRLRGVAEAALKNEKNPVGLRKALENCLDESEHIFNMLSTLLEISQARSGIIQLDRQKTDLSGLLEDLIELYSYPAHEKSISLISQIAGPMTVDIDANRMRQVFSNVLENALKYTPMGKEVLVSAAAEGSAAVVRIKDNGPGIAPEEMPSIFERFYRSSVVHSEPGFGLGLYLAKTIVNAHGGTITATSTPDEGAVFTISLPLYNRLQTNS